MSELSLYCHYQMVRTEMSYGEEFTVHEAFSTDSGQLYMVCPTPVYIVGESKGDIKELAAMVEKDIEKYGTVEMEAVQAQFDKYIEYTSILNEDIPMVLPDYSGQNILNPEEELMEAQDFYDDEDKVIDLVDFMKRQR